MKSKLSRFKLVFFAGAMAALAGCSGFGENKIKIVAISPDNNTVLSAGQKLDLEVTAEYTLTKGNGSVNMVIQDAENGPLGNLIEPLKKGTGRITLKKTITVPKTSAISVYMPLDTEGESKTSIVDSRVFKVNYTGPVQAKAAPAAGEENNIRITAISPDTNTMLITGRKIAFEVTVEYKLAQDNGTVSLTIQDAMNAPIASIAEPVKKGAGKLTLRQTITVPKTTAISVMMPLLAAGATQTSTVSRKVFKVAAK